MKGTSEGELVKWAESNAGCRAVEKEKYNEKMMMLMMMMM